MKKPFIKFGHPTFPALTAATIKAECSPPPRASRLGLTMFGSVYGTLSPTTKVERVYRRTIRKEIFREDSLIPSRSSKSLFSAAVTEMVSNPIMEKIVTVIADHMPARCAAPP